MVSNFLETIILTLINSGSIFLIVILLANSLKDKSYQWFTGMVIAIMGWVNFAYLGFIENDPSTALLFYRINGAFVAAFIYAEYMFYFEGFLEIKNKILKYLVLAASVTFGTLILFTNFVIADVVSQDWGNEIIFGEGNDPFSSFALIVNLGLIVLLIRKYIKFGELERRQAGFFLAGTFAFIVLNIVFNVISPQLLNTARYQHFGDYSAGLFLAFTAYAIIRRKFLNVRIALTAILIGVMSMLILVDIFALSRTFLEQTMKFTILIVFVIIAVLLIRSVLKEIRQREHLAEINGKLQTALSQIQEARRRERDMVDIMGHELRTPISIVKNALSFMDMQMKKNGDQFPPDQLRKYVDMGLESARREADLIETMLSATKADAKGFDLNFEKVDLDDVINDSFVGHKDAGIKKGLEVTFEKPEEEYFVYCDRTRIQEISDNLISNAIKYTKEGYVKVYIEKKENLVWVTIEDSGIGIPPEEINSLGKKFFRSHQHLSDERGEEGVVRPGGTGLGLYVSFALAKLMDGDYKVESVVGQGSKFSFGLPEYTGQQPKTVQRKLQDYVKEDS